MEVRVEPRTQAGQTLHEFDLGIGPHAQPSRHEDWLGNAMHWFSITDYHDRVEVACRSLVETSEAVLDPISIAFPVVECVSALSNWDFLQFGGPVVRSERLEMLAQHLGLAECVTVGAILERLSESLGQHLLYQSFVTNAMSTSEDALEAGAGVCQDFAHVSLGLLRLYGVPCRYVNGYLHI